MKCKKCLQEKSNEKFLTYYRANNILYTYHVCKECYSTVHRTRMLGTHHSLETIEKMAAKKRGIKQSPEHIEKRVSHFRGRKYSQEHIEKVRRALIGRKLSEEHKRATSLGHLGLKHTAEHCMKISQSNIGKHNGKRTPEQCKHISLGTKEGMSSPEVRKQCSERQKRILERNIYKIPKTEKIMKRILIEHFNMIEGKDFKHQYYVNIEHPYVSDFYIYTANLVIECDGDYWHSLPEKITEDRRRENEMDCANIRWIRFTETQLKKQEKEVIKILSEKLSILVEVNNV